MPLRISIVMISIAFLVAAGTILIEPNFLQAESPEVLEIGTFSSATPDGPWPNGWKPLTFPKIPQLTTYRLVKDGDRVAVKAASQASSSGLTKEILIDPKEYPIIQWQWKVTNILKAGDVAKKEGDDSPARLYVTFQYDSQEVGLFGKAKYEAARLIYGQYPPLGAQLYLGKPRAGRHHGAESLYRSSPHDRGRKRACQTRHLDYRRAQCL